MKTILNPHEGLYNLIVFSARDWSQNSEDAWIYGIVIGWDDAIDSICKKFHWDNNERERLIYLHQKFKKYLK